MNIYQYSWPKATWQPLCLMLSMLLISWANPVLSQDQKALFVVGNPASLNSSDQAMKTWMETDLNYAVTVADDDGIAESASNGHDIIFISSTISSSKVSTTFTHTPIPLFVWEYGLFDDLGLVDPSGTLHNDYGLTSGSSIEFVNPTDPMSGGQNGSTVFFSTPTDKAWALPNANATLIAQKPGDSSNVTYFRYDAGVQMFGGITAPAIRGILPLSNNAAINLTPGAFETIKAGITFVLPPPVASLYQLENPICVLEEPGEVQALAGITLSDGSSVIIGSTTASPRFHHRYNYTLDNGGKIIVDTIKGPPMDTIICQVINVPGFPSNNQFVDYSSIDLSSYTITNTAYFPSVDYDVVASRVNADGTVMWTRSFGSQGIEYFASNLGQNIAIASDGNILMTMGQAWRESQPYRSTIFKLDVGTGDLLWSKYAPMSMGDDRTSNLYKTSDDDLLTTGPSFNGTWNMHLQKLDEDANFLFGKYYYETGKASTKMRGNHVLEASDGNYLINGNTFSATSNKIKGALLNVSNDGVTVNWAKRMSHTDPVIDDPNHLNFEDIKEHPLGGYVATGYTDCDVPRRELLIARLNSDGSLNWIKSYSHPTETLFGSYIEILGNNDIVVTGYTSTDNFIARVGEADGSLNWLHMFASTTGARPFSIEVLFGLKIFVLTQSADAGALITQFGIDGLPNSSYECMMSDLTPQITTYAAPIVLNNLSITIGNTVNYLYEDLPMFEHFEDKGVRFNSVCPGEIAPCGNDPLVLATPSQDQNYIMTYSLREKVKNATQIANLPFARDVHQGISYFDGLGRQAQEIAVQRAPDLSDIVTFHTYDAYGRALEQFLPYAESGTLGGYQANADVDQTSFYASLFPSEDPMAMTQFEPSPLNRVWEQGAVGSDWQPGTTPGQRDVNEHTVLFKSLLLGASEIPTSLQPVYFALGATPGTPVNQGHSYGVEVQVTLAEDANGSKRFSFLDDRGLEVMNSVQMDGSTYASTIMVYDLKRKPMYILPPEAVEEMLAMTTPAITQDLLDRWCFQYQYDEELRVSAKKVPGADWVYLVYNSQDQILLTQDGNQRSSSKDEWSFTKYDELGRPIISGLFDNLLHPTTPKHLPSQMQGAIDALGLPAFESRATLSITDAEGEAIEGYTNGAFPNLTYGEVLSVTYYDDYDFAFDGISNDPVYQIEPLIPDPPFYRLNSKVTGIRTKVLDPHQLLTLSDPFLQTVSFFDSRYREVQTQGEHLHGTDVFNQGYNFAGEILASITHHTGPQGQVDVVNHFCYDHAGRLIRTTQQNNTDPEIVLSIQQYDFRNQVVDKKLHSIDGQQSFLQSIDYQFNIRNWLTGINQTDDSQAGPGSGSGDSQADLFGMELLYNGIDNLGNSALYNGNISAARWQQGTDSEVHAYNYGYDEGNRLIQADYFARENGTPVFTKTNRFQTSYSYDLNGNFLTLTRQGAIGTTSFGLMDDLSYTYGAGGNNRLTKVEDAISSTFGKQFIDGSNTGDDYSYDANGNLIADENKQMNIEYNHLNKPVRITFTGGANVGGTIDYLYNATGTKLQIRSQGGEPAPQTIDYINGFHYQENTLDFFTHTEGRIVPDGVGGFEYQYQITDHLGNSRVYFEDNGGVATITQVDAFYPFGLSITFDGGNLIANPENRYRYNGKEEQAALGLGWIDYGARMYDPTIGRWNGVDALSEKYLAFSPYHAVGLNPVIFVDVDGRSFFKSDFLNDLHGGHWSDRFEKSMYDKIEEQIELQKMYVKDQQTGSGDFEDFMDNVSSDCKCLSSETENDENNEQNSSSNGNSETDPEKKVRAKTVFRVALGARLGLTLYSFLDVKGDLGSIILYESTIYTYDDGTQKEIIHDAFAEPSITSLQGTQGGSLHLLGFGVDYFARKMRNETMEKIKSRVISGERIIQDYNAETGEWVQRRAAEDGWGASIIIGISYKTTVFAD